MQDYYEVLGVDQQATDEVIRHVYRRLAQAYHPDLRPDNEAGIARLKLINAAYETLADPDKRRRYDLKLGIRPTTQPSQSGPRSSQASAQSRATEAERAREAREAEERARNDRAAWEQAERARRRAPSIRRWMAEFRRKSAPPIGVFVVGTFLIPFVVGTLFFHWLFNSWGSGLAGGVMTIGCVFLYFAMKGASR
jgi:curved DNA-binding protein CbpA